MTPNDPQIDVLLRRYAGQAKSDAATEHLDADELSAFAEGSLPEAARSRYVSHLVECDDCRKLVTQLANAAGAVAIAEAAGPIETSLWQKLTAFFAPPVLRYAAVALVLAAAAGVTFFTLRHQRESTFVAQNEPTRQSQVSAVKPAEEAVPQASPGKSGQATANPSGTISSPAQNSNLDQKRDESKTATNSAAPPKPEKEAGASETPAITAQKTTEPSSAESQASYAPPPPTKRAETRSRERQELPGVATASGPRKSESSSDKNKVMDRSRSGEMSKDRRAEDDLSRTAVNQPTASNTRAADETTSAPKRDVDKPAATGRSANESRVENAKKQSGESAGAKSEETSETRSVGGRKFRRQGNAWIDTKFKSSMTLKNVSRGSSEFAALDSGLRSIAQQLGGEVIVVWKSKAYLIR